MSRCGGEPDGGGTFCHGAGAWSASGPDEARGDSATGGLSTEWRQPRAVCSVASRLAPSVAPGPAVGSHRLLMTRRRAVSSMTTPDESRLLAQSTAASVCHLQLLYRSMLSVFCWRLLAPVPVFPLSTPSPGLLWHACCPHHRRAFCGTPFGRTGAMSGTRAVRLTAARLSDRVSGASGGQRRATAAGAEGLTGNPCRMGLIRAEACVWCDSESGISVLPGMLARVMAVSRAQLDRGACCAAGDGGSHEGRAVPLAG